MTGFCAQGLQWLVTACLQCQVVCCDAVWTWTAASWSVSSSTGRISQRICAKSTTVLRPYFAHLCVCLICIGIVSLLSRRGASRLAVRGAALPRPQHSTAIVPLVHPWYTATYHSVSSFSRCLLGPISLLLEVASCQGKCAH